MERYEAKQFARDEFARDEFAREPEIEVETCLPGWVKCPGCSRKFALKDPRMWDGERHLRCGQSIRPTGQLS